MFNFYVFGSIFHSISWLMEKSRLTVIPFSYFRCENFWPVVWNKIFVLVVFFQSCSFSKTGGFSAAIHCWSENQQFVKLLEKVGRAVYFVPREVCCCNFVSSKIFFLKNTRWNTAIWCFIENDQYGELAETSGGMWCSTRSKRNFLKIKSFSLASLNQKHNRLRRIGKRQVI